MSGFLENLKTQTHKDLEIVMDHNDPSDYEITLINEYQESYNNLTHIKVEGVDPIGVSMNRCIEYSSGDYLCIWNVDDLRTPNSIEIMAKTLDDNPEVDFVYGNFIVVSSFGSTEGKVVDETGREDELTSSMILGPFFMVRKSSLNKSGIFDEQLIQGADYDLALRLAFTGKGIHIKDILGYYLNESMGQSTKPNSKQPLERTVIELRYGLNVLEPKLIPTARSEYNIFDIIFNDQEHLAKKFQSS
jgi:GT2 family glycosyltransferase